ncbi:hypothetical protein J1605_010844 [Eschrichtius robustus]|uniref:Uncharacterized protein n=1 Tax=Eschrichtius robustus TaxID=9764 RepID=A0AB34GMK2_ESCRO|nr:hypothetical protein J1605_010844 [Eschrichtius robustus]
MWCTGLVATQHVGSSRTRARTCVPCIGRQILNHCATREVPQLRFLKGNPIGLMNFHSRARHSWDPGDSWYGGEDVGSQGEKPSKGRPRQREEAQWSGDFDKTNLDARPCLLTEPESLLEEAWESPASTPGGGLELLKPFLSLAEPVRSESLLICSPNLTISRLGPGLKSSWRSSQEKPRAMAWGQQEEKCLECPRQRFGKPGTQVVECACTLSCSNRSSSLCQAKSKDPDTHHLSRSHKAPADETKREKTSERCLGEPASPREDSPILDHAFGTRGGPLLSQAGEGRQTPGSCLAEDLEALPHLHVNRLTVQGYRPRPEDQGSSEAHPLSWSGLLCSPRCRGSRRRTSGLDVKEDLPSGDVLRQQVEGLASTSGRLNWQQRVVPVVCS